MNQLIDNWYMGIAFIAVLIFVGSIIFMFFKQPSNEQLIKVKEWLLYAVIEAEKELGSGTGRVKLRYVYDLFITKFKWTAYLISFETFSGLVDEALNEMRSILAINKDVKRLVERSD